MNLLFTRKELNEIFNPRKPATSRKPPQPTVHRTPSTKEENVKSVGKPQTFSALPDQRMRQSQQGLQPTPTLPRRIPARKRTLSTRTSAQCESVQHQPKPKWDIKLLDLPTFKKRADVVTRFYHAKNTQQFEPYVPNVVNPSQQQIDTSEAFQALINNTVANLMKSPSLSIPKRPGPKSR
ncbi:hypothetical protein GE061_018551 [Apolygus lucorum]|uniref:Uncharacterized protein n=1 Tax=Apolygus lucorum TaxID=248454 RepID=A0A8S9XE30_APOLU|nr:hypothetical protein GE061_018551 [Apolygus lucorum]